MKAFCVIPGLGWCSSERSILPVCVLQRPTDGSADDGLLAKPPRCCGLDVWEDDVFEEHCLHRPHLDVISILEFSIISLDSNWDKNALILVGDSFSFPPLLHYTSGRPHRISRSVPKRPDFLFHPLFVYLYTKYFLSHFKKAMDAVTRLTNICNVQTIQNKTTLMVSLGSDWPWTTEPD